MDFQWQPDFSILQTLGERISSTRLNRNLSQAELANKAGITRRALQKIESGNDFKMVTLIKILRSLNLLNHLNHFLPPTTISPIQLAKLKGKEKQRASKRKLQK